MFSHSVSLSFAAAAMLHFFLKMCSNSPYERKCGGSLLPWWLIKSGLHWYWLFIVLVHVLNRWNYSELIKPTQICFSGTENSKLNSKFRVTLGACWTCFVKRTPGRSISCLWLWLSFQSKRITASGWLVKDELRVWCSDDCGVSSLISMQVTPVSHCVRGECMHPHACV